MINGKLLVHMRAPVFTKSGYGAHAREVIDYLLSDDRLIICLESINWGNTGYIHETDLSDKDKLRNYYQARAHYDQFNGRVPYDISVQVTIPNEFQKRAGFNIGITAGIEVDRCCLEWIRKCNEMDVIVVPSEHSLKVLKGTVYTVQNEQGQIVEERLNKPVLLIHEYYQKPTEIKSFDLDVDTDVNFLFVGLWGGKGGFWEDRKNVAALTKLFIETFKDNPKVGLILKTQIVNGCVEDRIATQKRIEEIKSNFKNVQCKIYLLHEDLTDEEMWSLYSHPKVSALLSLTFGEGFGRPLLEAASCGKPVIATNWSGHLDFLKEKEGFIPLEYDMIKIPECQIWEGVIEKESKWAKVREEDVKKRLRKFANSPRVIQKQAEKHVSWLNENFSKDSINAKWKRFFDSIIVSEHAGADEILDANPAKSQAINRLKSDVVDSNKQKVLYIMPQSAGDCLMSTAVINSLIVHRHWDTDFDFYIATRPQFAAIFDRLVEMYGCKVIEFKDEMMHAELTREVWDYVYNPGINVQYNFSNWLMGNGTEYALRLLEEFAKQCNLTPAEMTDYKVKLESCQLPEKAYVVVAPGGIKTAKKYKYWPDVLSNLKEMLPDIEIVQIGLTEEDLLPGALDYRGKSYAQSFYVVKNAYAVLAVDTFGAHIAGAMGVPHVVLYGSTHSSTCAPLMLKKQVPQFTIESTECYPKCYKDQCCKLKDGKNCLSHISPERVCSAIQMMIEKIEKENKNEDVE